MDLERKVVPKINLIYAVVVACIFLVFVGIGAIYFADTPPSTNPGPFPSSIPASTELTLTPTPPIEPSINSSK